jgi:hypothetical protein
MSRAYIFSDEAGCFVFERNNRVSRFFLVCTVTVDDCAIGDALLALRRELIWQDKPVREHFHATEDHGAVRTAVYDFLKNADFRADVTLLDKPKADPQTRSTKESFYKYAWYHHLREVAPALLNGKTEAFICAASVGTNKGQAVYTAAVNDVLQQLIQRQQWKTCFPRAVAEPCLQIADYCAWAVQRKFERGDDKWFKMIEPKFSTVSDLWETITQEHY